MKYYWVFCIIKKIFFSGNHIRMLEITIDNCHKCDFETINDPNNSQFFGIIEDILKLKLNGTHKLFLIIQWRIQSFFGQIGYILQSPLPLSATWLAEIFKPCASRCSKKASVAMPVLGFLCKTFSKLYNWITKHYSPWTFKKNLQIKS